MEDVVEIKFYCPPSQLLWIEVEVGTNLVLRLCQQNVVGHRDVHLFVTFKYVSPRSSYWNWQSVLLRIAIVEPLT